PTEVSILGRMTGTTVLTMWFADPKDKGQEVILTYRIRVVPNPEFRAQLERAFKKLGDEINCAFPDSVVCLQLVGDKPVDNGWAHDIMEAAQIMKIVRANYPDKRISYPEAARIPVDRVTPGTIAGEYIGPDGTLLAPGIANYVLGGSPNIIDNLK